MNETIVKLYDLKKSRDLQNKSLKERINGGEFMKIQAPMVRFSKLPFRLLCQLWGTDITYTPMIMAYEFNRSESARNSEFTTNEFDKNMVIQFGVKDAEELVSAAEKVVGYCDGIDINCGCPTSSVTKEGLGSNLLLHPERIHDMVQQMRNRVGVIPLSIKIRVQHDLNKTIELVKRAEMLGVNWITVHGRTSSQKSTHPVDYDAIKLVKDTVQIPVFANGDIFTLDQANEIKKRTNVNGVMAARGLLVNPSMFSGSTQTPLESVKDFINLYSEFGSLNTTIFHRHLIYMLYNYFNRNEKSEFNNLTTVVGIVDYLKDKFLI